MTIRTTKYSQATYNIFWNNRKFLLSLLVVINLTKRTLDNKLNFSFHIICFPLLRYIVFEHLINLKLCFYFIFHLSYLASFPSRKELLFLRANLGSALCFLVIWGQQKTIQSKTFTFPIYTRVALNWSWYGNFTKSDKFENPERLFLRYPEYYMFNFH